MSGARHAIIIAAEDELLMIVCSLWMHWMDQRLRISPTMYATDASPDEGGACLSTSLSARGRTKCRLLCFSDDLMQLCLSKPLPEFEVCGRPASCWGSFQKG